MSISFSQLHFADPSLPARRLFWHVLSIGHVCRDEPERHAGLDKAGLFLFRVVSGATSPYQMPSGGAQMFYRSVN
jgi:hypothetical protein